MRRVFLSSSSSTTAVFSSLGTHNSRRCHSTERLSELLQFAVSKKVFESNELEAAPVAMFYDLDVYDGLLRECKEAFGGNFRHYVAAKANPLPSMLLRAVTEFGFGIECASLGELLLATREMKTQDVVFDSPAKTRKELRYVLENDIRCHLDNFDEYDRAKDMLKGKTTTHRKLGFRVNPSNVVANAKAIAALSVSTPDSKFGVDLAIHEDEVFRRYCESPFLDSIHVHVGSGFSSSASPEEQLGAGVRKALDLALAVNRQVPGRIRFIDIGGGLPARYDDSADDDVSDVSFWTYANHLRTRCPELFDSSQFTVLTEFGQSLNAKAGFLASRVEFVKKEETRSNNLAIIHFGADLCLRQAYANDDHPRRFAAFDSKGHIKASATDKFWTVGGPLCFQGDILGRDLSLPQDLAEDDIIVMKDAGANTLSLFSRHCSRLAPPVYGLRVSRGTNQLSLLKPRESIDGLATFWTGHTASHRQAFLNQHRNKSMEKNNPDDNEFVGLDAYDAEETMKLATRL